MPLSSLAQDGTGVAPPGAVFRMVFPYELIREGPDPVAELFAVHKGPFSYVYPRPSRA